ncbi:MAG: PA14 domain-containing protein, partial [Anaerolineae bacterium]|nr:PA14 domain-containing protein [Anaerolineae bacterium]
PPPPPPPVGSWHAEYFDNQDCWWNLNCTKLPSSTEDFQGFIRKNWGTGSPPGVPPDNWSARFTGTFEFAPGSYVFHADHDDGTKIFLDGSNIMDVGSAENNYACPARYLSGSHQLRVIFREDGGDARLNVDWSTDATPCTPCYSLAAQVSPAGSGSITVNTGPNCSGGRYTGGTNVSITAYPASGYTFSHWSGDASGTANPASVTMDQNRTVIANFSPVCIVPSAPSLSSPGNGSTTDDSTPTFVWSSVGGATSYQVQVDDSSAFGSPAVDATVTGTAHTPTSALAPGTYHWRVRARNSCGDGAWSSTWTLTVSAACTDAYEPDDGSAQARLIGVNGAPQVDHRFCVAGDQDWVKFAATAGRVYTVTTLNLGAQCDTVIHLLDQDGATQIIQDDDGGGGLASRIVWTANWSGYYFVKARHYSSSAYGLDTDYDIAVLEGTPPPCSDPYEPNNASGQATPIAYGQTKTGAQICPAGDLDYYAFYGQAGDVVIASVTAAAQGSALDSYLSLFAPDGSTVLAQNDDTNGYDSQLGARLPASGTYYLRVREYSHPNEGGAQYFYSLALHKFQPPTITSNLASAAPLIDGEMSPGEWGSAAVYDITSVVAAASGTGVPLDGKAASAAGIARPGQTKDKAALAQAGAQPAAAPVRLYVMNDATHLYLAIDNPNDAVGDAYDQMGIYFDDNPLPSDGQWTNTSCGHADGEGNFWVITDSVEFREIAAGPGFCSVVVPAPGTGGQISQASGHSQAEIAIDLTASALRAGPWRAIGMYLFIFDEASDELHGSWPAGSVWHAPATYGSLSLAGPALDHRAFLPLIVR